MAAGSVKKGTDPSGTPIATHVVNEGGEDRNVQRVDINDSAGREVVAGDTGAVPAAVTVGNGANGTQLLAANVNRKGAIIYNASTVDVFIGFSATGLTTSNGIKLFPGGSWPIQGWGLYRGVVHGIVATGTADVRVQEWT